MLGFWKSWNAETHGETVSTAERRSPSFTAPPRTFAAQRSGLSGAPSPARTVRAIPFLEATQKSLAIGSGMEFCRIGADGGSWQQATPVPSARSSGPTCLLAPSAPPSASCCTLPTSKFRHDRFSLREVGRGGVEIWRSGPGGHSMRERGDTYCW